MLETNELMFLISQEQNQEIEELARELGKSKEELIKELEAERGTQTDLINYF